MSSVLNQDELAARVAAVEIKEQGEGRAAELALERALRANNPIVQKSVRVTDRFHEDTISEMDVILAKIASLMPGQDISLIKTQVIEILKNDVAFVDEFIAATIQYNKEAGAKKLPLVTFPIRSDEVKHLYKGALALAKEDTDELFEKLGEGRVPDSFDYHFPKGKLPALGADQFWGGPKGTRLKLIANTMLAVLEGKTSVYDLGEMGANPWIHKSALAHAFPMPKEFSETLQQLMAKYDILPSMIKIQADGSALFCLQHSGYVIGGSRYGMALCPDKTFPPEDCTSWLARLASLTKLPVLYTNADLHAWNWQQRQPVLYQNALSTNALSADWAKGPEPRAFDALLEPKKLQDPQRDLEAGDIMVMFNAAKGEENIYSSKHAFAVLGFESNGADSRVLGLECNRDTPKGYEGIGTKTRQYGPIQNSLLFAFNKEAKAKVASELASDKISWVKEWQPRGK